MKKASFSALLYREYAVCTKTLGICAITSLIFTLFPILIALSLRFGNLAMLPASIIGEIRVHNDIMLKLYAVICPCMLSLSVSETSVNDTMSKWDHFRRSTPVSPARMALAKYVFLAIMVAVSLICAIAALAAFSVCMDTSISRSDMGLILLSITIILIMSILAQLFIMLLRSVDKGMLAMIAALAVPIFLMQKQLPSISIEGVLSFAADYLSLFPVIIGMTMVMGFCLTTLLYKRRGD
ncbi:MAG: ABC-2 transporter permease [Oscillospiraceae bacterium]|nr:ABC-2 transporter permease [Oscillospiraceae bacterium]